MVLTKVSIALKYVGLMSLSGVSIVKRTVGLTIRWFRLVYQ